MRVRVRRKNSARQGTIVGKLDNGDVWVEWDDEPQLHYQIQPDLLTEFDELAVMPEGAKAPARTLELQLLDALDRLRDSFNLAIECAIRDIQREMKK